MCAPHASLNDIVASYKPKEEQRRFQFELADIVLREGIAGRVVDLAIAALDEPDDKVRGYALICVRVAVEWPKTAAWVAPERVRGRFTTHHDGKARSR